jgi:putative Mg2+ transporter-C (MgtC) family protein
MLGCIMVVAILFLFSFLDRKLEKINQMREYRITFPYEQDQQHKYEDLIKEYGLIIHNRSQSKNGNIITGSWIVQGSEIKHHAFIARILDDDAVTGFDF